MKKVSMETAKETIQIYKKGGRICSLNGKILIFFFLEKYLNLYNIQAHKGCQITNCTDNFQ